MYLLDMSMSRVLIHHVICRFISASYKTIASSNSITGIRFFSNNHNMMNVSFTSNLTPLCYICNSAPRHCDNRQAENEQNQDKTAPGKNHPNGL